MQMRHPSILLIMGYSVDRAKSGVLLISEFCAGGNTFDRIYRAKDMTVGAGLAIATQVVCAVRFLHCENVVHRDVKSPNVFLSTKSLDDPLAKLGDFGGSRVVPEQRIDGRETPIVGTIGWKAPEVTPHSSYGPPVDIYSLGVFISELVSRRNPYADVYKEVYANKFKQLADI